MSTEEKWILLTIAPDPLTASLIKGKLESVGIPVIIRGEAVGPIYGLTTGPLAEKQIYVPESHRKLALDILIQLED